MCKLCAIAARYSRPRRDSLVFDLRQFTVAATTNPLTQQPQIQQLQNQSGQQIQEKFP
jgi:hypothetical protein